MAKRKTNRDRKPVTLPSGPTSWDTGAQGPANTARPRKEEAAMDPDADGKIRNPNGIKRLRYVDMIEVWHGNHIKAKGGGDWISTAQFNTAEKLRDAWEGTKRAPGTDYARPRVDSSPKPDHAVTIQIDRLSRWHQVAKHITPGDMQIIMHCAINGLGPATLHVGNRKPYHGRGWADGMQHLRDALDRLANVV